MRANHVQIQGEETPEEGPLAFDTVYHGDSLAGMRLVESESIDLVITSPPYADMKVYEGGFGGFHPDEYVKWFLPYVAEIGRILKPTGSFILNINDKSIDGFRHPFIFELIYAIHNAEDYCGLKGLEELDMHGLRMFERLFWNKGSSSLTQSDSATKWSFCFGFEDQRTKIRHDADAP